MLNPPPPLFDAAPAAAAMPAENAKPSLVLCGAQNADATDWWDVANAIANAIYDAQTMAELDRVRADNLDTLRAMTTHRRDLALILSAGFQDRRVQLGGKS